MYPLWKHISNYLGNYNYLKKKKKKEKNSNLI